MARSTGSHTYTITCQECNSRDCTSTAETVTLDNGIEIVGVYRHCNHCGHSESEVWSGGKTLVSKVNSVVA